MPAPNQHNHNRKWKEEVAKACARLCLCAVLPDKWTANARITTICTHGVKNTTTVYRLAERQFCCRSQASKAHDPAMKSRAAKVAWDKHRDLMLQKQRERWGRLEEREKHSKAMLNAIETLREEGWSNPGWGWSPTEDERKLPGTLYLIRYLDESGTHFKLGITKLTLAERFGKGPLISIVHLHNATLGECFDLEQDCLRHCKQYGWRYSSPTTTELIHPDGLPYLLDRLTALASIA
jgi:hypothetical protein